MGAFFFYNNRKPRKFNHSPILYNVEEEQRKARLENRIREIKKEMNVEVEPEPASGKKTNFQEAFLSETKHLKKRKAREADDDKPFFTNNTTLVIIILALGVLFYIFFLR